MKKNLLPIIFIFLVSLSTQGQMNSFHLKMKVNPDLNGTIFLHYKLNYQSQVDSAQMVNGKSEIKGKISEATLATLSFLPSDRENRRSLKGVDLKKIYLEKGVIPFTSKGNIQNGTVNKSPLNKEFENYIAYLFDINKEVKKAQSAPSSNLVERKANDARYQVVMEEKREQLYQYISDSPESFFSITAINDIISSKMDMDRIEKAYNSLAPKVKSSKDGLELGDFIEREQRTKVGTMAMDFTQNDVNDQPVKLSDFRGKYVLIDFWASWCGPCRVENPHLVKAYNQYKDKNFTILGVSLDNPGKKQDWLDAIAKDGLMWNHVSDLQGWKNEVAVMYGIRGVPASFLIDPNGKIVAKRLRENDVMMKLKELLD